MEKIAVDRLESKQRVAAEMVAGLARGSKHWGFEESQKLREYLVPVMKQGLSAIIPETAGDWSVCFSACLQDKVRDSFFSHHIEIERYL